MRRLRRRIPAILALAIVAAALSAGYGYFAGGGYTATARLFVGTSATNAQEAAQGDLAGQARARTYAALGAGPGLLDRTAQRLGPTFTGADLAGRVSIVPFPETVLLEVTARDQDPARAAAIADALSTELTAAVTQVETPINGGNPALGLLVIQPAENGIAAVGRFNIIITAAGALVGLIFGITLALAIPLRDERRSADEAADETDDDTPDGAVTGADGTVGEAVDDAAPTQRNPSPDRGAPPAGSDTERTEQVTVGRADDR